jgi:membrane fusion protein
VLSLLPMAGESGSGTAGGASPTVTTSTPDGTAGNSAAAAPQAKLYAPSRTSGFVEPGQAVWLRLHAFPHQKFGMVPGQVTEVSRTPVLPQDLPSGMTQALLCHRPPYRSHLVIGMMEPVRDRHIGARS